MVPVSYSVRNLMVRRTTTAATALGIGLVVFVFASVLMLGAGLQRAMGRSGSADVAIVLRAGSDAESSSGIELPAAALVTASPEVRVRPDGRSDAVGEVVGVLALDRAGGEGMSNVQVRGVPDDVYRFRPSVHVVAGRAASPGSDEVVVGAAIRGRFLGVDLGQSFEIKKNRRVRVVGVIEDRGSSFESEVWGDIDTVRAAFGREALVSSVRVRLRSAGQLDAFKRAIETNPQLGLTVKRESVYYEELAQGTTTFLTILGLMIAFFFSAGAMIGAMITMHASVAQRSREIGTLRALGFSRRSILASFLFESVVLSLAGGVAGALASLAMGLVRFNIVNFATWSEVVFTFVPTPSIVVSSLLFAALMGLLGGFFPAVRAARMNVLDALRA
ncbi:MAG: ABC transporter permease [Deltaproteobacteria bacterium]|nr:ABC transporter permease [Deltaproteobacteria bacterium]